MRLRVAVALLWAAIIVVAVPSPGLAAAGEGAYMGRWDITMPAAGEARARSLWLEVSKEGEALKGLFQSGGGATLKLPKIEVKDGELVFEHTSGRPPKQVTLVYRAQIKGGRLEGTLVEGTRAPRPWTGVKAPSWPDNPPRRKAGAPIELLNGKDLSGWIGQNTGQPKGWAIKDGVLVNTPPADNIYSEKKFKDFKIEVEFSVDKGSNSGIYLRGRYEIQVADSHGQPQTYQSQGAIYGFAPPKEDASKPAGEWQKIEATIIDNRVTVILNGKTIVGDFAGRLSRR